MKGPRGQRPEKIICAREECNNKFVKKVHNQKFCSTICCQKTTNARLLKKYYDKKKPVESNRVCKGYGCHTLLSKYNKDSYCELCKQKQQLKVLKKKIAKDY